MDTNNENIRYTNVHVYRGGEVDEDVYIYSPPAWRVCEKCNGEGIVLDTVQYEAAEIEDRECSVCNGTGRIPLFYSPEQWQEAGGILIDDTPCWFWVSYVGVWQMSEFKMSKVVTTDIIIIATEAGRPPEDYKEEKHP